MNDNDKIILMDPRREYPSELRSLSADRMLAIIEKAEHGDTREMFALYRDISISDNQILSEFSKRKDSVLADSITALATDKNNPQDVEAAKVCQAAIDSPAFFHGMNWLLNASLWPVAVCEKVFKPSSSGFELSSIVPVNYQLLDYQSGFLKIFDLSEDGLPLPSSHDPDPQRYLIHRLEILPVPDHWGGPMRSILFWWLFRSMGRQWWADLLERFGIPFLKGKYSDNEGRKVLESAFRLAVRLGGIVISKNTEVEIVQAASGDSSNSHERMIELCNREISKLIVGQTLSSQATPTGEMGGGTANLQGDVREDKRRMDQRNLIQTLREGLFRQLLDINGLGGCAIPKIIFGSESARELNASTMLLKSLSDSGLEPDDSAIPALSEKIGFSIRRKQQAAIAPFSVMSAQPNLVVAQNDRSRLASAFAGRYAPLKKIISESASPEECVANCRKFLASLNAGKCEEILEEALEAFADQGAKESAHNN